MPFPYPQDTNSTLPTRLLFFYRSYIPRRNGCPESSRVLTILQILKHFSARLRKAKVNSAAEARREICNSDFSDRFLLCPYFHVTLSLSLSVLFLSLFLRFFVFYRGFAAPFSFLNLWREFHRRGNFSSTTCRVSRQPVKVARHAT